MNPSVESHLMGSSLSSDLSTEAIKWEETEVKWPNAARLLGSGPSLYKWGNRRVQKGNFGLWTLRTWTEMSWLSTYPVNGLESDIRFVTWAFQGSSKSTSSINWIGMMYIPLKLFICFKNTVTINQNHEQEWCSFVWLLMADSQTINMDKKWKLKG